MDCHLFPDVSVVEGTQVTPESDDVQIDPPHAPAASLVPSAEEVMDIHEFPDVSVVEGTQVAPESDDIQIHTPLSAAAASLVPSAEDVTVLQNFPEVSDTGAQPEVKVTLEIPICPVVSITFKERVLKPSCDGTDISVPSRAQSATELVTNLS